jgi:hypothetical protein
MASEESLGMTVAQVIRLARWRRTRTWESQMSKTAPTNQISSMQVGERHQWETYKRRNSYDESFVASYQVSMRWTYDSTSARHASPFNQGPWRRKTAVERGAVLIAVADKPDKRSRAAHEAHRR